MMVMARTGLILSLIGIACTIIFSVTGSITYNTSLVLVWVFAGICLLIVGLKEAKMI